MTHYILVLDKEAKSLFDIKHSIYTHELAVLIKDRQLFRNFMLLLLILTTSAWGLSELRGGDIPNSDIFHSAPRIRRLFLLFNLALWLTFSFPVVWIILSPLFYIPPLPIRSRSSLKPSQFHPLPTSSPGAKRRPPGRHPHPPTTSHHRSSLCPAPHACVSFYSRASSLPPFPPSACTQVPVGPWGVIPLRVPPCICVPASSSPSSPHNIGIVPFWCLCRGNCMCDETH